MAQADARLRDLCLSLPEASEQEAWGRPTYRVRGRIFAMPREADGHPAVWLKAPAGAQDILVGSDPERFFRPPYVGPKGWVGIVLDAPDIGPADWDEVTAMVTRSYRLIAPKRLAAGLET